MGCGATKVAHDQTLGPSRPASKRQPNAQSPVVILSTLDDRLVAVLEAGDIRLLRVEWVESQPEAYGMQRRQELEALQEEIEKHGGLTPLLGYKEAADLVRNGKREAGALSYGWILPWNPDPTGERTKLLRKELSQRPYIKGLFWDQATLYQPPRTEAQQGSFERALEAMMDLYASAVGTTCAATPTPSPSVLCPLPPLSYYFRTLSVRAERISRRVLQIKGLPPRPSEYDGLLCLGGVPAEVDEAMLRAALQRFGSIESIVAPKGSNKVHQVKFTAHKAAKQATIAAPNLDLCKYAFIAYRDYDPYDGRGW